MGDTPASELKAKKIKDLLQSYYKDAEAGTPGAPSTTAAPTSRVASPRISSPTPSGTSLDASYFDADRFLKRLTAERRLGDLADQHRQLVSEVSSLDSDMHMLVYENYNKFISATDIIKSMNGAVEGLDDKLQGLDKLLGGVLERSDGINTKIEAHQSAIEELNHIRLLLYKVQLTMDVPTKMRAAMDRREYEMAAEVYADAAGVLQRYGTRPALTKAATEAQTLRTELAQKLKSMLVSQPDDATDCIRMIAKLGEPTESLQDDFLGSQTKRLTTILRGAEKELTSLPSAGILAAESDLKAVIVKLNSQFFSELTRTAALFTELFSSADRPRMLKVARDMLLKYLNLIKQTLTAASGAAANRACNAPLSLNKTSNSSQPSVPAIDTNWGMTDLVEVLHLVHSDLPRLDGPLHELAVKDKAGEVVENGLRTHIRQCFTALEERVVAQVQLASKVLSQDVNEGEGNTNHSDHHARLITALSSLHRVLTTGIQHLVLSFHELASQRWILADRQDEFLSSLMAQMYSLMVSLASHFKTLSTPSASSASPASPPAALLLVLWKLAASQKHHLPDLAQEQLTKLQSLLLPGKDPQQLPQRETEQAFSAAADALVDRYAVVQAGELEGVVERDVDGTDWVNLPDPKAPRGLCQILLSKVTSWEGQIIAVGEAAEELDARILRRHHRASTGSSTTFETALGLPGGRPGGGGYPDNTASGGAGAVGGINGTTKHSRVLVMEDSVAGVLAVILARALKLHAAALRRKSLSRAGFQQVQLDCHYLRPQLQRLVSDAAAGATVQQLLDELMATAAERCSEPILMEPAVLDRLIALSQSRKI